MNSRSRMLSFPRLYVFTSLLAGAASGLKRVNGSRLRGGRVDLHRRLDGKRQSNGVEYSSEELNYFNSCTTNLLSDNVLGDGTLSQNDFANNFVQSCLRYTVPSMAGATFDCPDPDFTSFPVPLQLIFVDAVCPESEGNQVTCLDALDSLNVMGANFGYIATHETMTNVEMVVENLCFELFSYVFLPALPVQDVPTESPSASSVASSEQSAATSTEAEVEINGTAQSGLASNAENSVEGENGQGTPQGGVLDLATGDGVDSDSRLVAQGNELGTGPIIGIATAAAACLLIFFLVAGRRHSSEDQQEKSLEKPGLEGSKSFASAQTPDQFMTSQFDPKGAAAIALGKRGGGSSVSRSSTFNRSTRASGPYVVDQIIGAIDKANWDEVYKLASQLAEQEDLSTLSSVGKPNAPRASSDTHHSARTHLSEEDQERTLTLDELVESRDWTGVAVTAALYAGESGSSRGTSSSKRGFLDVATGKRTTSRAAAAASFDDDSFGGMPSSTSPHTASALGPFTDDTKSDTTDEGRSFTQENCNGANLSFETSSTPSSPNHISTGRNVPPAGTFGFSTPDLHKEQEPVALGHLREKIDHAVDSGDWDKVLLLSSEVEKNNAFSRTRSSERGSNQSAPSELKNRNVQEDGATCASMRRELEGAVYHGDWALVSFYAERIKEGAKFDKREPSVSQALVPAKPPASIASVHSADTSDSEMAKKQTIEKLIKAEKWKGVSIMAGLYEMESKGSTSIGRATEMEQEDFTRVDSQNPNSLKGAKLLVPYWQKRKDNHAGDPRQVGSNEGY